MVFGGKMIIYQWSGTGSAMMRGCNEYLELAENEEEFTGDYKDEQGAIEARTAPGFTFDRKYDTDIDTDFAALPLGRTLEVRI